MTIVTVDFPDERIKANHIHVPFLNEDDAVTWAGDLRDRFGRSLIVSYSDSATDWQCSKCSWRLLNNNSRRRAMVAVGRDDSLADL